MFKLLKYLFAAFFLFAALLSILMSLGRIPESKVVAGVELSDYAKNEIVGAGLVSLDEKIEYYYSEDMFSFVDYGNFFTDLRVISYELDADTGEQYIYSALYGDISDIKFQKPDDLLEDSLVEIYEGGELSFYLVVSSEDGGDETFYNALLDIWKSHR